MTVSSPPDGWYKPIAAHLGDAYLKYAFTKGTVQEVEFLTAVLGLEPGMRLLDVGMGPGRHSVEFASRGIEVVGVDLSEDFVDIARRRASDAGVKTSFYVMDALEMPFEEEFDAVIAMCEGAFGLGLDDLAIIRSMARAAKPGARLALAAINVFYVLEHIDTGDFDVSRMLYVETQDVIGADGTTRSFEMYNSCFTPRELEWLANGAGLDPQIVYGVEPGAYQQRAPVADDPELLLIASKPVGESENL